MNTKAKSVAGFTLIELMTALAVLGVLFGIAIPAFGNMMRNSQIAAESNNLLLAMTIARSEALKQGVRVSVCAASSATTCAGTTSWSGGWVVFSDDFGAAGAIDASDVVLQSWAAPANGVSVVTTTSATAVTFDRTARVLAAHTFRVSKTGCSGTQRREIKVERSGRVGLNSISCT